MNLDLSDKAWLFNINHVILMVLLFSITTVVLFVIYIDNYKTINKSTKGFYPFLIFSIFSVLMFSFSVFLIHFGDHHYVGNATLQTMPKQEKQIAIKTIKRLHQPLNLFQQNMVTHEYQSVLEKEKQKEVDKDKMRQPEVVEQLKSLEH